MDMSSQVNDKIDELTDIAFRESDNSKLKGIKNKVYNLYMQNKDLEIVVLSYLDFLYLLFEKEIDDYLGKIYHELGIHNKMKGQFFTPFHLSKLMAETRVNELIKELNSKKRIKIIDAACGSGCLMLGILAVLKEKGINYQKSIFINCSDLDENTIQMAYVQLTIVGAKAKCENKNSLTGEIFGRWDTFNYSISGNTSLDLEVDYGRYKE